MGEAKLRREAFEARVTAVWSHATPVGEERDPTPYRYVPRGWPDGKGWGVYDKSEERFVEPPELMRLPLEALQSELLVAATH